jgi:hypothetical protein
LPSRSARSRAYGTAGTTPFATDLSALTNARKILQDNGAPLADLQFVGDTACGPQPAQPRHHPAGITRPARRGAPLGQFLLASSASRSRSRPALACTPRAPARRTPRRPRVCRRHDAIPLITGTGTILAGDVVTFAGDTNKYVVNTGARAGHDHHRPPWPEGRACRFGNDALTVGNNYTANLAFERNAVVGIMRPPLMPANPTIEQMLVSDDKGMTYLMLQIAQYGMLSWELHLAWGFKTINGEFSSIVLG